MNEQPQGEDGKRMSGYSRYPTRLTLVVCSFDQAWGGIMGFVLVKGQQWKKIRWARPYLSCTFVTCVVVPECSI
jgi:hypothetical protein